MKKKNLFVIILIINLILSCSTDSNNNEEKSGNDNNPKLVKSEYVSNNFNLKYSYDENSLLTRIEDIQTDENINSDEKYIYDSSKNVVKSTYNSNTSSYNAITDYSYNSSNLLISANTIINDNNTKNIDQNYSYDGNLVTVEISSTSDQKRIIILETNSEGLITQITNSYFYSIISYDSNENITEINTYDNFGKLIDSHKYSYDNKINPFYGQLKSIYIPRFLNAFIDASYGEFVFDGYEGYYFPYFKNNITKIIENGNLDRNYIYKYNNENYPKNSIEEFQGENAFEFSIEY